MRKKCFVLLLCAGLLCITGCGAEGKQADAPGDTEARVTGDEGNAGPEEEEAVTEGEETAEAGVEEALSEDDTSTDGPKIVTVGPEDAKIRVGMVSDMGGIDDHSFNQGAWYGLLSINEELNARVTYIEPTSVDEYYDDLCTLADNGNSLCWGIGYQFADAVEQAAADHPDVHFAIVDHEFEEIPPNVTCAVFRAEEPSFLVGYIAASMTKSGKIGFLGGMDVEPLEAFQYGYLAGVSYADQELGKKTEVVTDYLGTFTDPGIGKEKALQMYADGCDIIFHAAGGAGVGVIEAAEDTDNFVIGVDTDQAYLAPDNVLTSAIKNVKVVTANLPVQFSMGEKIGGIAIEYGLSEGALGIPASHPNIPDEIYDNAMKLKQKIIQKEITVPKEAEG